MFRRIQCADGFTVSIQASAGHYCEPRINNAKSYTHVELGYPNQDPPDYIKKYVEWCLDGEPPYTNGVYPRVPSVLVDRMINEHGGIVDGECPPLNLESVDDDNDDNDDDDNDNDDSGSCIDIDSCSHILSITVSKGPWGDYCAVIRYLDDTNNMCEGIKSSSRLTSLLRDLANIVEELG